MATTRSQIRASNLKALDVEITGTENTLLSEQQGTRFNAVLELIGNSTILDSLKLVRRGGGVRLAGFLGCLAPVSDFNSLLQMASGVNFSFFGSFVFAGERPAFPLSAILLQGIVEMVAEEVQGGAVEGLQV